MQNDIKAIYDLSSDGEGVRFCDIAEKVDVSKASVCNAMKNLEGKGLVRRDIHGLAYLSNEVSIQRELHLNKFAIISRKSNQRRHCLMVKQGAEWYTGDRYFFGGISCQHRRNPAKSVFARTAGGKWCSSSLV